MSRAPVVETERPAVVNVMRQSDCLDYSDIKPLKAGVVITRRSRSQKSIEVLMNKHEDDFLLPWMPEA